MPSPRPPRAGPRDERGRISRAPKSMQPAPALEHGIGTEKQGNTSLCVAANDTNRPTPSHQTTHLALHRCASCRIHLVTYAMMESRLRMEAKHQGGPVRTKLLPAAMERYGALQQGLHAQG
jgi:hypothetical protein